MTEVIVALIGGGVMLLCNILTNKNNTSKIQQELKIHQAVTDTKIEELTREVREHNNFAKRMPIVENEIKHINQEIHTLEGYHK